MIRAIGIDILYISILRKGGITAKCRLWEKY